MALMWNFWNYGTVLLISKHKSCKCVACLFWSSKKFESLKITELFTPVFQSSQREIWRLPAQEREKSGGCLSSMKLNHQTDGSSDDQRKVGAFVYSFSRNVSYTRSTKKERQSDRSSGLHECSFSCGDHVVILNVELLNMTPLCAFSCVTRLVKGYLFGIPF